MSRSALLEQMTALAAQRREDILAEARTEADRIVTEARSLVDERRAQARATAHQAARQLRDRRIAQAEHLAEKELLTLRDRVVEDVLSQARRRAQEMAETPVFEGILKALLAEVTQDAPNESIVEVPPDYVEHCRRWVDEQGRRGVQVVPAEHLRDGVALHDRERTFRAVNTLTSRFDRVLSQARRLCMHRLFEETRHARS